MRRLPLLALLLLACDKDEADDSPAADDSAASAEDFAAHFSNIDEAAVVDCTLSDGTETTCYALTVSGQNPSDDGPYCPETLDDVGGVGVYDGETNPGFQVMKRERFFEAMEADGYDVVDEEGNIRVLTSLSGMPDPDYNYCLALEKVDLTLTYLLPTTPVPLSEPHELSTVEALGVQLDGITMTADPPSVVDGPPGGGGDMGGGDIPSIDPCGGHPDPAGYYHAHFVAESMNSVLVAYGMDGEVSCTRVDQGDSALVGFAKDGYPIYSPPAEGMPEDLDACNGRSAATDEFPDGTYHYVASDSEAPNMPPCLMGAFVDPDFMTYE